MDVYVRMFSVMLHKFPRIIEKLTKDQFNLHTIMTITISTNFIMNSPYIGLLSGFDSKRFHSIFATIETTEPKKTSFIDNEFSGAARARG